jgi:hypothetical protein
LIREPLPDHFHRLIAQLPGGDHDIIELKPAQPLF